MVMFRQRDYHTASYAHFVCCLRTLFPWFCNSNGPQRRVLWGNPSPFPVANIITGNWIRDVYRLKKPGGADAVVRPPIPRGRYFVGGPYRGGRRRPRGPDRLLPRLTPRPIRPRGARGGLFFVDRRKLLAGQLQRLEKQGMHDEPI